MANYATVEPTFWTGDTGRALREAGVEAQLVALYLLTNTHRNAIGIYYLPKMLISHETALTKEGASKGLQRGILAGFCAYDGVAEVVWVKKMAAYQIGAELKPNDKRVKWINELYQSLPNNAFLYDFYQEYGAKFYIEKPRGSEGASKALASPIEDPSKPVPIAVPVSIPKVKHSPSKTVGVGGEDFERFWSAYPRKVGKLAAQKAWAKLNGNRPDIEQILSKLEQLKQGEDWTREGGRYIPHPTTWINAGGWFDECQPAEHIPSFSDYEVDR